MESGWEAIDELLLSLHRAVEGLEKIDFRVPENTLIAEVAVTTIGKIISDISQALKSAENPIKELGGKPESIRAFETTLDDIIAASSCLSVHFRIISSMLLWSAENNPFDSPEQRLVQFREAAEDARNISPPERISGLHRAHEALLEILDTYISIFSKLEEAARSGNANLTEAASRELARLETKQSEEPIELFSMLNLVVKAQDSYSTLKKELT